MKTTDEQLTALKLEWAQLVESLKLEIRDEYRATDEIDDETPAIELTIGFTPETPERDASWGYQTGDNSFTGGAYSHPHWAVVAITRDCVASEIFAEIANQLGELVEQ